MTYDPVRGMRDILPDEVGWWRLAEEKFREVARLYNYREIRFPILEATELFTRGIGESTDVVGKQMYTFPDRKGRSLTLRPEGTASAARAYLTAGLQVKEPFQKWFYIGPMFRYEKPQKGRSRQFHQYGIEAIGSLDPGLDAEVISLARSLMERLGLGGLRLRLNSIGCAKDREAYREALKEHFSDRISSMCTDCRRRYRDNPIRILDCKEEICRPHIESAPKSVDHLCAECREHLEGVRERLGFLGLGYELDYRLVRGLDYYTRTVFELSSDALGAQDSLIGGGRYDGLIESLGGPPTPAIGFAGGMERLVLALQEDGKIRPEGEPLDLFIATLGDEASRAGLKLAEEIRSAGLSVDLDHRGRSFRKQLNLANRLGASSLLVLGDEELESKEGKLKDLSSGKEEGVELISSGIIDRLRRKKGV
ncbi:MAG TPA: histidine--tRNA ligase [Candidatus Acetothermia bacterium]|nr:histidine--tRNA ligase [Candidatus Acetothermia bacterium]